MATAIEQVQRDIQKAIDNEPTISNGTNISVMSDKVGFLFTKRDRIILAGSVKNEIERKKIEEIARQRAGNRDIVNKIKIGR